jgi:hypothetical protein
LRVEVGHQHDQRPQLLLRVPLTNEWKNRATDEVRAFSSTL